MFLSLAKRDKHHGLAAARRFAELGFAIVATQGTAEWCEANGIPVATSWRRWASPSGWTRWS